MGIVIWRRVQTVAGCDRLLLLLTIGWSVEGTLGNYFSLRGSEGSRQFWVLLTMMLWAAISVVAIYSVIRQQRRPSDYGFSWQRGGVASLAAVALIYVYLTIRGDSGLPPVGHYFLSAWGAFMEELTLRAIAIDKLILLLDGVKRKVAWAVLASTILWTAPHIVSKLLTQLLGGIVLGGLVFGYIYYKSRSILLPAVIHGIANAGFTGGLLIVAVYCAIAAVDYMLGTRRAGGETSLLRQ